MPQTDLLRWIYFCSVRARHVVRWQTKHPLCETHAGCAASVSQWHPCAEAAICTDKSLINVHKQQSDPPET